MSFSCAWNNKGYGTHKTPVSDYEVLIIKKLLNKGKEKNYLKRSFRLNFRNN
ncbi:hypothetical protein CHA01nite_27980 [Chryseobacterium hagamense]|uniref:Uncharacterized protein n=1 Tax=Chryseobacterium hagamense TaxID=395935 RepID=A0A511YPD2_9FLAO|nr:hypothetical protein CHA01nite_27980 [Chryseobacterium hagamense]